MNQLLFEIQSILESWARLPTPIFDNANQNIFNHYLIFVKLYQRGKSGNFMNLFWRNSSSENPAIWLAESILAYISKITFFPIQDLCRNTVNKRHIHYRPDSVKIKPYFWPIYPIFGAKQVFFKTSASVMHNIIRASSIMPKFRKI